MIQPTTDFLGRSPKERFNRIENTVSAMAECRAVHDAQIGGFESASS